MSNIKYDVLSPDGFSISRVETFDTKEDAEIALDNWIKRYEQQGYYSSRDGRIPYNQIKECCEIIEFEDEA